MIEVCAKAPERAATGYVRHVVELRSPKGVRHLCMLAPEDTEPLSEDWLVPPALCYAMREGDDVRIQGRVSPMLLGRLDEIQSIYVGNAAGQCELERVRLEAAEVVATAPARGAGTASMFSAGLDAFYTALTCRDEIDHLIYMGGTEFTPDDEPQLFLVLPHVKAAAEGLGKPLSLVDGDHWDLLWRNGGRTEASYTGVLVMAGLLLGSRVQKLLISGSYVQRYEDKQEHGMDRFLALWRTEAFEPVLYGNLSRSDKMQVVAASPVAMDHLRVCWARRGTFYNCGRCFKCLRTMVNLALADAEGRCHTLPPTLDLTRLARMHRDAMHFGRAHPNTNLIEAEAQGREDLATALRAAQTPARVHKGLARHVRRLFKSLAKKPVHRRSRRTRRALEEHKRATGREHLFCTLPAATEPAWHADWRATSASDLPGRKDDPRVL